MRCQGVNSEAAPETSTPEAPWASPHAFKRFYEKEVGLVYYVLRTFRLVEADQDEVVQETLPGSLQHLFDSQVTQGVNDGL